MSKVLRVLSIAAILTVAACSNPNVPRLPESEEEDEQQDSIPPNTGDRIRTGLIEPGLSASPATYPHA